MKKLVSIFVMAIGLATVSTASASDCRSWEALLYKAEVTEVNSLSNTKCALTISFNESDFRGYDERASSTICALDSDTVRMNGIQMSSKRCAQFQAGEKLDGVLYSPDNKTVYLEN